MVLQAILANPHFAYSIVRDLLTGIREGQDRHCPTFEPAQACLSECPVIERLLSLRLTTPLVVQPTLNVSFTVAFSLCFLSLIIGFVVGRFWPLSFRFCKKRPRQVAEPIAASPVCASVADSSTASSSTTFKGPKGERGCWTPSKVKAFASNP